MTTQQINLYQPVLRKQRKLLSAATLVQGTALVLVGLLAIYGYGLWQVRALEQQVAHAAQQQGERARQLQALAALAPARGEDTLARSVEAAQADTAGMRRLLEVLSGTTREGRGFGDHLEGLARQRVDGLWITAVRVRQGGAALEVRGSAVRPELVPRLVQRLGREAAFRGMEFEVFSLQRAPDGGHVDFVLRTHAGEAG
ncbi:PilN domain-containing protein [Ectothiorhodospiraceae bacterium 2226]|nr:PilN domain-containing protein [Ectothiorhodospiraceae bacterium 2226]